MIKYILTNIYTGDTSTFGWLTDVTLYIEGMSGPISTNIDYIDQELKHNGRVTLKEGWMIRTSHRRRYR